MRAKQRLADIDIAEPRDHALVQQRRLQAGLLVGAGARQHRGVEFIAERLGTEALQQRLVLDPVAGENLHVAEAARIVENNRRARRHVEHDMVVRAILVARMMEFAGRALAARRRPRETSRTCRDASAARRRTQGPPSGILRAARARSRSGLRAARQNPSGTETANPCAGPRRVRFSRPPSPAAGRGGRFRLRAVQACVIHLEDVR